MKLKLLVRKTVLLADFPYLKGQKVERHTNNTITIDLCDKKEITKPQERFLEKNKDVISYWIKTD